MDEEILDESFFLEENNSTKNNADVRKTGLENTFSDRQVGSIAVSIEPVSVNSSLDFITDIFSKQPGITALPVEDNDHVIGVIEKSVVEEATSNALKRFVSKSCGEYVVESPLILDSGDYLEKIAAKAFEAAIHNNVKTFVVLHNNRSFYGIVSVEAINKKIEELKKQDSDKAVSIQENILKKNTETQFPFDVVIYNKMANGVGGDFYVSQKLSEGRFFMGCFDVSGKNFSAALLTITLGSFFSMLKQLDRTNLSGAKIISMLDKYLQEIVPLGNFITGVVCFVDYSAGYVQLFNCGHTNSFVIKPDQNGNKKFASIKPTLPPFGMGGVTKSLNEKVKTVYKLSITPGLQIDFYTDGLTDMVNDEGIRFEEENTEKFFMDLFAQNPYTADKYIDGKIKEWIGKALMPDDITVMNIRF